MKLVVSLAVCLISAGSVFASSSLIQKAKNSRLEAIPATQEALMKLIDDKNDPITKEKVELGKKLYFDPRMSKSGLISCNTCHNLGLGGADGIPAAIGHGWTANPHHLNSPTVYNSVFFKAQFWDGRSPHLADQAQGPVQAGPEMAAPPKLVEDRINSIAEYVQEFKGAYGDDVKIDFEKITATIATFEKTLVTPSKFDDFLNGDENALNKEEKEGLVTFIDKGCTSCHSGIALGGTMQPFQIAAKYKFTNVGDFKGDENGMVKTPTLRNITETAPYFHNGQIWSLSEAVKEMGSTQLGIKIDDNDAAKIVTFLKALKGDKPEIIYPQLPESSINTPKPSAN
ncbi:cytochrome c biogenesis protein CcsA [Malaciobacter pacificus]|uniref:Periplasmic diheme cytochrome c peroxidase n=1 Tax=Malaciobacter pacificus TaxID=1080223 RepID=A0A5C2H385_9BACT|nr:cytochrome-c peroxidase [Malaciobacter pacificus]QEP33420.1 periplasmic diheme cytochrome c peroxidase [Malaciobacter pacificus]GGD31308.1 cytochrome c biogenesis protein CcsA [Malaciobacter pacificus]